MGFVLVPSSHRSTDIRNKLGRTRCGGLAGHREGREEKKTSEEKEKQLNREQLHSGVFALHTRIYSFCYHSSKLLLCNFHIIHTVGALYIPNQAIQIIQNE